MRLWPLYVAQPRSLQVWRYIVRETAIRPIILLVFLPARALVLILYFLLISSANNCVATPVMSTNTSLMVRPTS